MVKSAEVLLPRGRLWLGYDAYSLDTPASHAAVSVYSRRQSAVSTLRNVYIANRFVEGLLRLKVFLPAP